MRVISTVEEFREYRKKLKVSTIGFVPTMGALHAGHLELVAYAKRHCESVIVSIYVNPSQFGKNEDLENYPRTLQADLKSLETVGVDAVFTPSNEDIYPNGANEATQVVVPVLSTKWCGESRPQFFKGITKVVLRLFNIVQPTHAIFGEKDFQQLRIIRRMVTDLFLDIEIIGVETLRENNGLAMSSRNQYLTAKEKEIASVIHNSFNDAKTAFKEGQRESQVLTSLIRKKIQETSIEIDYLTIVDPNTLEECRTIQNNCRIIFAGTLNKTRLIDNAKLHF